MQGEDSAIFLTIQFSCLHGVGSLQSLSTYINVWWCREEFWAIRRITEPAMAVRG